MAKLVPENHPALHTMAEEVPLEEIGSAKIQKVIKDMRKALLDYNSEGFNGVAIAAPQIGVSLRIFLVHDTNPNRKGDEVIPELIAINPRITKLSKKKHVVGEGCLSIDSKYGAVSRSLNATIEAYDEHAQKYIRGAGGLLAQIFQHEVDHLDGMLFVDRAEKVWDKTDEQAKRLTEAH